MSSQPAIEEIIEFPKEIKFSLENKKLKVSGPKGEINKDFSHARAVEFKKEKVKIKLSITKMD